MNTDRKTAFRSSRDICGWVPGLYRAHVFTSMPSWNITVCSPGKEFD
jgi:hypothetical protein